MKSKELREKNREELRDLEQELKKKLFALRIQLRTGKLKNTNAYREAKRDIARVKTIMREKQLMEH